MAILPVNRNISIVWLADRHSVIATPMDMKTVKWNPETRKPETTKKVEPVTKTVQSASIEWIQANEETIAKPRAIKSTDPSNSCQN